MQGAPKLTLSDGLPRSGNDGERHALRKHACRLARLRQPTVPQQPLLPARSRAASPRWGARRPAPAARRLHCRPRHRTPTACSAAAPTQRASAAQSRAAVSRRKADAAAPARWATQAAGARCTAAARLIPPSSKRHQRAMLPTRQPQLRAAPRASSAHETMPTGQGRSPPPSRGVRLRTSMRHPWGKIPSAMTCPTVRRSACIRAAALARQQRHCRRTGNRARRLRAIRS
ncbi:hypothetical protein FA09DRAFT_54605 [Tilletiopsis washingtonensis]|uniref:Uncharacterized protein n=1 Tax=Tilletiopsis washingtonensis TaxID=58919 RepID=A0A316ZB05_9BASI|nr:hypothetical protein FA09DRAFT_54605 [Tilletiopsis washingtonensis]PWN97445.1 hypothetical protein FA09DRAFT_54605 [Tilletiopsis washingtonensis]